MEIWDKDFFRHLLHQQLHELQSQAGITVRDLLAIENFTADPLDQASFDTDYSTRIRIRGRESRLINKILSALERLDEDTFGLCEECGCEISLARLKARPVAALCIKCKTRQEANEQVYG